MFVTTVSDWLLSQWFFQFCRKIFPYDCSADFMKNHENRIDFESISVASRQIELALVIYLRQFYAQQIWLWFVRFHSWDSQKQENIFVCFCFPFTFFQCVFFNLIPIFDFRKLFSISHSMKSNENEEKTNWKWYMKKQ